MADIRYIISRGGRIILFICHYFLSLGLYIVAQVSIEIVQTNYTLSEQRNPRAA